MSRLSDRTAIGGSRRTFETTCWSRIGLVRTCDPNIRRSVLNDLIYAYWKPVYWYLRQRGYTNERAKDLTQGFFSEILLGRDLVPKADPSKGRFRTFLLAALNRYVSNEHRRENAKKRKAPNAVESFDAEHVPEMPSEQLGGTPEQAFDYVWASLMLDDVLSEVKKGLYETSRATYWEVFRDKVLAPIFEDAAAPSMAALCGKYGIDGEQRATNMLVTVKRQFRRVLESKLRRYAGEDAAVETELGELIEALSAGSPGHM